MQYDISPEAGQILSDCVRLAVDTTGLQELFEDVFFNLESQGDGAGDRLHNEVVELCKALKSGAGPKKVEGGVDHGTMWDLMSIPPGADPLSAATALEGSFNKAWVSQLIKHLSEK